MDEKLYEELQSADLAEVIGVLITIHSGPRVIGEVNRIAAEHAVDRIEESIKRMAVRNAKEDSPRILLIKFLAMCEKEFYRKNDRNWKDMGHLGDCIGNTPVYGTFADWIIFLAGETHDYPLEITTDEEAFCTAYPDLMDKFLNVEDFEIPWGKWMNLGYYELCSEIKKLLHKPGLV